MTTTTPDWAQAPFGAYATTNLVGREEILAKVNEAFARTSQQPTVLFLTGEGGIGKTRLLQHIIELAKPMPGLQAVQSIIDFYHVPTHNEYGLAESLYRVLTPPNTPFTQYEFEKRTLERMRLSGEMSNVGEQRARTLQAFTDNLNKLAQSKRIVLALDTAERLVYSAGQEAIAPALLAECWGWLLESLAQWRNITLIIAGRDSAHPLMEPLKNAIGNDRVAVIQVESFSEAESMAYFDEVERTATKRDAREFVQRVRLLDRDTRLLAHRLARGRSIMLALLVDYLTMGTGSLSAILHDFERSQQPADQSQALARLKTLLVDRLIEVRPLGAVISALGRTPKGCDHVLLAKLLEISEPEAKRRLDDARRLSIVKVRPSDDRVFLHDEMYAMLRDTLFAHPADAPAAERTSQAILDYYRGQIERNRAELDRLYAPVEVEGRDRLDLSRLSETHTALQTLWTEFVFYELRSNAVAGFKRYYRLIREASLNGDTQWDAQLQAELQTFLVERGVTPATEFVDELPLRLVRSTLMPRPMVRAFANGQYEQTLTEGERLRREMAGVMALSPVVNEGIVDTWEASALIYLGGEENLQRARSKLSTTIDGIRSQVYVDTSDHEADDVEAWRARAVLAFAYRVRGYLHWATGALQTAATDYRHAATLWRRVNLKIEMATTLKDMGFVLSEVGDSVTGRNLVMDALALQRELGLRASMGLSMNTLALIEIRESAYESGISFSEKALALFRALGDRRGAGLALIALAEAKRRLSGTEKVPASEKKVELLRAARDHAQEAFQIFMSLQEKLRKVEALIEWGCACRDWVHVRRQVPSFRDDVDRLFKEAEEKLTEAASLATDSLIHKKADALVNLAWLGFYAEKDDLLDEAVKQAKAVIPEAYHDLPSSGTGVGEQPYLWPQFGKLDALLGRRAFQRFTKDKQGGHLEEATRHYARGLEYDILYSHDHRGLRQVKTQVYENFKHLNPEELAEVHQAVRKFEEELGKQSEMYRLLQGYALLPQD